MAIRKATPDDLGPIARLASVKRKQYEKYQPVFHRENQKALELHMAFLKDVLAKENMVALVSETDGTINGFIIGALVNAPPVYEPGGMICFVDDFMVEKPELWTTVGRELLETVTRMAKEKGAVLLNVVCGPLDLAKKRLLANVDFQVASEWHVKRIH